MQIHYLELPKLPDKDVDDLEGVELWLSFLKEASKDSSEIKLKRLRERSKAMSTAIDKLQEISADDRMRELQRAREKSRLDTISRIRYAEKQAEERGLKRGMERGLEQAKLEMVKNLINVGLLSNEQIAEVTNLNIKQIEKIRQEVSEQ